MLTWDGLMGPKFWSEAANQYEHLIAENRLTWIPLDKTRLPSSTRTYFEKWLEMPGLLVEVASEHINGTILMKIDDPVVVYLHHDPATKHHQFADQGFHNALDNNLALARLAARRLGLSEKEIIRLRAIFEDMDNSN
jgi:hypothetical protein